MRQIPDAGFCFALLIWNKRSEQTCRRRDASIGNQCPVGSPRDVALEHCWVFLADAALRSRSDCWWECNLDLRS